MKGKHHVEGLEGRTLLSGWSTVEDFNPPGSYYAEFYDVAADAAGNVYAVGDQSSAGSAGHGIVLEKPAGSSTWATLLDYGAMSFSGMGISFNAVAVSAKGDVYVAGSAETGSGWVVLEQPAGQSGFTVVDQVSGATNPGTNTDLAIDAAGNVFAVGEVPVQVTVKTGGKTTTRNELRWTVRERAAGAASFTTVDQFVYSTNWAAENYPYAVAATSTGIYVVGDVDSGGNTPEHWIVRKSADAGATWKTVDDYQWDSASTSRAQGVAVDAAGAVYVTGEASQRYVISTSRKGTTYGYNYRWVVRKSTDGGATWPQSLQTSMPINTLSSEVVHFGMGTDAAGNVYAVHPQDDAAGIEHSIVRSSAAGWQPIDDYQLAPGQNSEGFGFAAGPDGTLYACGYGIDAANVVHGIVRSMAGPAPAPATQTAAGSPLFSGTPISAASQTTLQATSSTDPKKPGLRGSAKAKLEVSACIPI